MIWKTLVIALLAVGAFADVGIPTGLPYEEAITEYCKKNGAEDKVGEVKGAITNFVDCIKGIIDIETINNEIEEAKPIGALDEVFKKYCAKAPELKSCWNTLLDGVNPCLDTVIRSHVGEIRNGTSQLLDFVCYKDGDRIALFYAEGGPTCLQSKISEIRECADKIKNSVNLNDGVTVDTAMQCRKYDELTACIVTELEKCDTPTPGNMAESLFKYIRNSSPCPKKQ